MYESVDFQIPFIHSLFGEKEKEEEVRFQVPDSDYYAYQIERIEPLFSFKVELEEFQNPGIGYCVIFSIYFKLYESLKEIRWKMLLDDRKIIWVNSDSNLDPRPDCYKRIYTWGKSD